ncbi:MAG: hypothetical protein ACRED8_12095 [Caulobacteraceae bacterium]
MVGPRRLTPPDARRGGLVLLGDPEEAAGEMDERARAFAADGYETLIVLESEALETALEMLDPPRFAAGWGKGATRLWLAALQSESLAAASCHDPSALPWRPFQAPLPPLVLHLPRERAALVAAIAEALPELPVHLYEKGADAERLARLRDLRLFALNGGGRGEI